MQDLNHIDSDIANDYQNGTDDSKNNNDTNNNSSKSDNEYKDNPYHDKYGKFTTSGNGTFRLSKKEYAKLSRLINTYPKKWNKDKINRQIIDDNEYFFRYNDYDDFNIVKRRKYNNE